MNRYELLAEDVFDPVLDLWCNLVVLRWPSGKAEEQGADLGGDGGLAVVIARFFRALARFKWHSRRMIRSVADMRTRNTCAGSWR